ncbi:MAG: integrase arm-type DNA-binding domain-containing protein [Arenimonas sp.]
MQCRTAKPTERDRKMTDAAGLYLLIKSTGSKYWRIKYRHLGKEKVFSCGIYPTVSLADARGKREEIKRQLSNGIDPMGAKKLAKREATPFLLLLATSSSTMAVVTVLQTTPIVCEQGIKAVNERKYQEAFEPLNLCLGMRLNRNERSAALQARARAYSETDMPEKALEDQNAAMGTAMDHNAWPLIALSDYQKQLKQYDNALVTLKKAEEFDEDRSKPGPSMPISYHRARIYLELGRHADAVDELTRGIARQSNYWAAYYYRGLAYHALGKTEEAKADFVKVAELSQEMGIPAEHVEKLKEFGVSAKLNVQPKKP